MRFAGPRAKEESTLNVKPEQTGCAVTEGTLPGTCAPMVFPFIAMQTENSERYDSSEALKSGTLFPTVPAALAELMALDFAIDELGLYLDTHPNDSEALELFNSYIKLAQQGRTKYEAMYGPLAKKYISEDGKYTWINDPWPWEIIEGGKK